MFETTRNLRDAARDVRDWLVEAISRRANGGDVGEVLALAHGRLESLNLGDGDPDTVLDVKPVTRLDRRELLATGRARGTTRLLHLATPAAVVSASRSTSRGPLRLVVNAQDGETREALDARARKQLDELELIAETVAQPWPRLDGETPSRAEHWLAHNFVDHEVIAWLEAGVPWATSAAQLRAVGLGPADVSRELEQGWSLGLIYARDEMDLVEVQALVVGQEGGA